MILALPSKSRRYNIYINRYIYIIGIIYIIGVAHPAATARVGLPE